MHFRWCLAIALLLYLPASHATQLPESYGVYYKEAGKYHPVQRTLNNTPFNQIPIANKAGSKIELLVHAKNFDHKRAAVVYKNLNPLLGGEVLNIDISPLKRKDTYKIVIKNKLPNDGMLIYQYKGKLLGSEIYALALRDPEKSLEDLFNTASLPYKQRNVLVRNALTAYPKNTSFQNELKKIEQEAQVMAEERSYNVALGFAKSAPETDLNRVRDTYKTHLQQFPNGKHNKEITAKLAEVETRLAEQEKVATAQKASEQALMEKAQTVIDNYITAFNKGNCSDALQYVIPTSGVAHYTKQCKGNRKYEMLKIVGIRGNSTGRKGEKYVLFFTKKPKTLRMMIDEATLKISQFN